MTIGCLREEQRAYLALKSKGKQAAALSAELVELLEIYDDLPENVLCYNDPETGDCDVVLGLNGSPKKIKLDANPLLEANY